MKRTLSKHAVIKPGDDLWQWAARTDTTATASITLPSPVLTPAERSILYRLWLSLRGMMKSEPARPRLRRVAPVTPRQELLP